MYLLKLALRPWRLAPLSQLFAAVAVGFLLLLVGLLFWMQQGLKSVLIRLQGEQVVTAYLDASLKPEDQAQLVETLKNLVESSGPAAEVAGGHFEIKLVDPHQFVGSLRGQYPDLVRELEGLGSDLTQVVPRYISISGVFPQTAVDQIKLVSGVESAESSRDRYHHVVGAFMALRWLAKVLTAGICFALLTGLIHLSKVNSYLHEDALTLLRFWGAGFGTLVGPGTFSGLLVGLLGGGLAFVGWMTGGAWLSQRVRSLSIMLKGMPLVHTELALSLLTMGALIGLLAGALGSFSSHRGGFKV